MKRYHLKARQCTRKIQITGAVIEQVRKEFSFHVMHALLNRIFKKKYMVNMDQTNVSFNLIFILHCTGKENVLPQ